jgi:hypothetical protein
MNTQTASTGSVRIRLMAFEQAILAARKWRERLPFSCSCGHRFARLAAAFGDSR